MVPLDVLSLEEAKAHLNVERITEPGGDDELAEMIGAAVERVQRHLGGRELTDATYSERLACKVVTAEFWRTQNPSVAPRPGWGGASQGAMQDDGPTAPVSLATKLTALLGPPVTPETERPGGSFPPAQPWPDPIRIPTVTR